MGVKAAKAGSFGHLQAAWSPQCLEVTAFCNQNASLLECKVQSKPSSPARGFATTSRPPQIFPAENLYALQNAEAFTIPERSLRDFRGSHWELRCILCRAALALRAELLAAGVGFVPAALAAQNGAVSACAKERGRERAREEGGGGRGGSGHARATLTPTRSASARHARGPLRTLGFLESLRTFKRFPESPQKAQNKSINTENGFTEALLCLARKRAGPQNERAEGPGAATGVPPDQTEGVRPARPRGLYCSFARNA